MKTRWRREQNHGEVGAQKIRHSSEEREGHVWEERGQHRRKRRGGQSFAGEGGVITLTCGSLIKYFRILSSGSKTLRM